MYFDQKYLGRPTVQLPCFPQELPQSSFRCQPQAAGGDSPIRLVLPHWFDAVFENVEVGVRRQFRRPHQVVVNVPELLTAGEGGDQFQVLIKRILSLLAAGDFATVPQAIRRLEIGETSKSTSKCYP